MRDRLGESRDERKERTSEIDRILGGIYPETTALRFANAFQLLVATILSAQSSDRKINEVTAVLFEKYPDPRSFAEAMREDLERDVFSTGYFRQKARALKECCTSLVEDFGGEVPRSVDELVMLPGVGRKTANMVLGNAEGLPGVVVDTHVGRLAGRMGLTVNRAPEKIERDLEKLLPKKRWTCFSNLLIYLGREVCTARKAMCGICPVSGLCPKIGVS